MKISTLLYFLVTSIFTPIAQNYYVISFEGTGVNENPPWGYDLYLDNSNPSNIWQIGSPQKNMFTSSVSIPNVIVTDTLNDYPINDTSSFIIEHIADLGFSMPHDVIFSGYYFVNSDTLTDYGLIEFSPDNGGIWIDLINDPTYSPYIIWLTPKPILTGNSIGGWSQFAANLSGLGPFFGIQTGDTVLWKFTFVSDPIQTNNDGLMFDNLSIWDVPPIGIEELNSASKDIIKITDLMGRQTADKPNTTLIYIYSDGTTEKVYRME